MWQSCGFAIGIPVLVSASQAAGFKLSKFWISDSEYISVFLCIVLHVQFIAVFIAIEGERTDPSQNRSINSSVDLPQPAHALLLSDMSVGLQQSQPGQAMHTSLVEFLLFCVARLLPN